MSPNRKPKKNPVGMFVALTMLLLMLIALFIILRSCTAENPVPAEATAAVSAEPSAAETDTPAPSPTETPEPTPTPTETPSPTPEPTEAPVIEAGGSFRSNTGTGLNLVADWTAESSADGNVTVTVALSAESYSLQCSAIHQGATVTIGGDSFIFDTPAIANDGSAGLSPTSLGAVSVTLPRDEDGTLSVPITASWKFGGSYSGMDLPVITAEGTAAVG